MSPIPYLRSLLHFPLLLIFLSTGISGVDVEDGADANISAARQPLSQFGIGEEDRRDEETPLFGRGNDLNPRSSWYVTLADYALWPTAGLLLGGALMSIGEFKCGHWQECLEPLIFPAAGFCVGLAGSKCCRRQR